MTKSEDGPRIGRGELPLLAFISSVMNAEMEWARVAAVEALQKNPLFLAWTFEFTPGSSEPPADTYLRKVREAALVVWLVGSTTTDPVRNEVLEAIAAQRRLLVARCTTTWDEATEDLLARVRPHAKWIGAATPEELVERLDLTVRDEFARALSGAPSTTRLAELNQLRRASRARLIRRWESTGLGEKQAATFADDPTVGLVGEHVRPTPDHPLRIIVAPAGSGKSVAAERLFQRAVEEAALDARAPVPVYLRAREAAADLEAAVLVRGTRLGDLRVVGAFVVIDGADEIGVSGGGELLGDAQEFVLAYPTSRVVITTRPLPGLKVWNRSPGTVIELRTLERREVEAIAARVGGRVPAPSTPQSLAEAVRRPLFAILFGLSRSAAGPRASIGSLLSQMVERVVEPSRAAAALPLLRALAVKSIDLQYAPVPLAEITDIFGEQVLSDTRLVTVRDDGIEFTLPIVAEWFAAQVLLSGELSVEELARKPFRLERWRYAMAIAIATGSSEAVEEILESLTERDPGLAGQILRERDMWGVQGNGAYGPPSNAEATRAVRRALGSWWTGLSPLSAMMIPSDGMGGPLPVTAVVSEDSVSVLWGEEDAAQRWPENPEMTDLFYAQPHWRMVRPMYRPGWAWRGELEELRKKLYWVVLYRFSLHVPTRGMQDEALWIAAHDIAEGRGSSLGSPVPLDPTRRRVEELRAMGARLVELRDRIVPLSELTEALARHAHNEFMADIWPGPDMDGEQLGVVQPWQRYSPEAQGRRVQAIAQAALEAYEMVAAEWLPRLMPRMEIAGALPAEFVGFLRPGGGRREIPRVSWHLDPLAANQPSRVRLHARDSPVWEDRESSIRLARAKVRELRGRSGSWIGSYRLPDVFRSAPLTGVVKEWIWHDLRRLWPSP